MRSVFPILPELVSGRWQRAALTEGHDCQPRGGGTSAMLAALAPLPHLLCKWSPSPSKLGEDL